MRKAKCVKPIVVTEEMYWYLVERKFRLRVHSIDEVLRLEMQDLPADLRWTKAPVKVYSFEDQAHIRSAMMDDIPEPVRI